MRKILFGCTIFFLIALVAGGVLFYKGCVVPIRNVTADVMQMTKLGGYNAGLTNKAPYTPPADGVLTPDQIGRFLAVQTEVRAAAGASFTRVRERFESLPGRMKNAQGEYKFDFNEMMSTFKGIGPDIVKVKEAQVAALNQHGFSLQEYRFVRESILRAMGEKVGSYIEDLTMGPDSTGTSRNPKVETKPPAEARVPAENVAAVKTVADSLKAWLPVAALGF